MLEAGQRASTLVIGGVRARTTPDSSANHDQRDSQVPFSHTPGIASLGESPSGLISSSSVGLPVEHAAEQPNFPGRIVSPLSSLSVVRDDSHSPSPLPDGQAEDGIQSLTPPVMISSIQLESPAPTQMQLAPVRPPLSKSAQRRQELVRQLREMQQTVNELEEQEHSVSSSVAQGPTTTSGESDVENWNEGWQSEMEELRRQVAMLQTQLEQQQQVGFRDDLDMAGPPPSYVSNFGVHNRNG